MVVKTKVHAYKGQKVKINTFIKEKDPSIAVVVAFPPFAQFSYLNSFLFGDWQFQIEIVQHFLLQGMRESREVRLINALDYHEGCEAHREPELIVPISHGDDQRELDAKLSYQFHPLEQDRDEKLLELLLVGDDVLYSQNGIVDDGLHHQVQGDWANELEDQDANTVVRWDYAFVIATQQEIAEHEENGDDLNKEDHDNLEENHVVSDASIVLLEYLLLRFFVVGCGREICFYQLVISLLIIDEIKCKQAQAVKVVSQAESILFLGFFLDPVFFFHGFESLVLPGVEQSLQVEIESVVVI
jgi:hypothetical protein